MTREKVQQTSPDPTLLEQGELGLLESTVARRLLSSRIPARFADIALDGTPRVLATWFHWTGELLSMPTFVAAPHVRHPAGRLRALRAIDLHPTWVGVLDFQSRLPSALGGVS